MAVSVVTAQENVCGLCHPECNQFQCSHFGMRKTRTVDVGIDIVITVSDNANQVCPTFPSDVQRIHWSIDDPFRGWNFNANQLDSFRETRRYIRRQLESFLDSH